jgi:glycosyltransferase involved in cell wall biosynthesis
MIASPVFRRADRISVVSTYLWNVLHDAIHTRTIDLEKKTVVLPMPVNSEVFKVSDETKRRPGSIITASRLTEQKRLDILIDAARMLTADGMDVTVEIYGDGPARGSLTNLVASQKLDNRIKIHEPVPQDVLAEKYRRSEIAVLVSEREGFGLTLPEAMLCGCAAVGSRSGGITDIISEEEQNGMLVEPGDSDSLYRVLKMLLTDREKLLNVQRRGTESAQKRYSMKAGVSAFSELFNEMF